MKIDHKYEKKNVKNNRKLDENLTKMGKQF